MTEEYMETLQIPGKEATENAGDDDFSVEVVDDTPESDRGREPLLADPEPSEDELASYSDRVKKRISTLQRAYHDERRAKEQALREHQEALKYAQTVLQQNKTLVQKTNQDATLLHETWRSKVETDLQSAKQNYKAAYESGDSDAIISATEAMQRATLRHEQALVQQPAVQKEADVVNNQSDVYTSPPPDKDAQTWASKNQWFGKDRVMTSLAYGVHEELVQSGIHPQRDAVKYYEAIDKTMRQRFPDYNWGDSEGKGSRTRPSASVVAPVTRTATGKKVALTQTQVAIAKRLNIPLAEYAKQVAALQGAR